MQAKNIPEEVERVLPPDSARQQQLGSRDKHSLPHPQTNLPTPSTANASQQPRPHHRHVANISDATALPKARLKGDWCSVQLNGDSSIGVNWPPGQSPFTQL